MFWPLVLPFQITACICAVVVVCLTALAPKLKWKRTRTFFSTSLLAFIAFVPSCTAIMHAVDARRFGYFSHATLADVNDFRVERYLPATGTDFTIYKIEGGNGFLAKYSISKQDLATFINESYDPANRRPDIEYDDLHPSAHPNIERMEMFFTDTRWDLPENVVELSGLIEDDGGGFTLWFDPVKSEAFQRTGYW